MTLSGTTAMELQTEDTSRRFLGRTEADPVDVDLISSGPQSFTLKSRDTRHDTQTVVFFK